jgi:hypothetical protein
MIVSLRRLTATELQTLAPAFEERYAADLVQNGGLDSEAARRKAVSDVEQVFADPTVLMYAIQEDGRDVGRLCVGERELQERRALWVWDVFVEGKSRSLGYQEWAVAMAKDLE